MENKIIPYKYDARYVIYGNCKTIQAQWFKNTWIDWNYNGFKSKRVHMTYKGLLQSA